jgi:hypothetical protein
MRVIDAAKQSMECPMSAVDDLSRSLTVLDQDTTLIARMKAARFSSSAVASLAGRGS